MRPPSILCLCLALGACASTGHTDEDLLRGVRENPDRYKITTPWDKYDDKRGSLVNEVHDANSGKGRGRLRRPLDAPNGWCLSLAILTGMDRMAQARRLAETFGMENPMFLEQDGKLEILVNHYEKSDEKQITSDLQKWQRARAEGAKDDQRPFETAALRALPAPALPDAAEPLDARRYTGFKTLIVAFYNEKSGDHWREEAKRVAQLLRKEGPGDGQGGVEAFWRVNEARKEASVLVGLFTMHDDWVKKRTADPRDRNRFFFTEGPGPAVDALLVRFPHLLLNNRKVPKATDGLGVEEYEKPAVTDL